MRKNKIKQMWKEGKPAVAAWLSTGNPYLAEVLAHAGFDAVVIDMQHGMGVSPEKAIQCLQAISTTDTVPVVRMSWNDPKDIQFVLDAGAYGVIVPLVNTKEEAEIAVGASKYPPIGFRSAGPNRATLYAGQDYLQNANEEIFVLVMIETTQAINNLEEIATVPGLDGFYVGPADLAISLGVTPGPDAKKDPRHIEACQKVVDVAKAHGLIPCHHGSNPDEAADRFAQGFMLSQIGSDGGMVTVSANNALNRLRELGIRE
jgi:4-hydroxy-2-oxoheptanedioate aldolase